MKVKSVRGRLIQRFLAVAGLLIGLVTTSSATGNAAVSRPDGCPPDRGYNYVNAKSHTFDIVPPATGTPGTPLSIQIAIGLGVTGTVGGSVSGDVSLIIAGAKAEINASLALSWTASVTYGAGPWVVPSGVHEGALHAGAERDSFTWQYGAYNGGCRWVVSRTGPADLPWKAPYFWHTTS